MTFVQTSSYYPSNLNYVFFTCFFHLYLILYASLIKRIFCFVFIDIAGPLSNIAAGLLT